MWKLNKATNTRRRLECQTMSELDKCTLFFLTVRTTAEAINYYLQKGCVFLNHARPWSSLSMHAKFGATRLHGFGIMDETDLLTD